MERTKITRSCCAVYLNYFYVYGIYTLFKKITKTMKSTYELLMICLSLGINMAGLFLWINNLVNGSYYQSFFIRFISLLGSSTQGVPFIYTLTLLFKK